MSIWVGWTQTDSWAAQPTLVIKTPDGLSKGLLWNRPVFSSMLPQGKFSGRPTPFLYRCQVSSFLGRSMALVEAGSPRWVGVDRVTGRESTWGLRDSESRTVVPVSVPHKNLTLGGSTEARTSEYPLWQLTKKNRSRFWCKTVNYFFGKGWSHTVISGWAPL